MTTDQDALFDCAPAHQEAAADADEHRILAVHFEYRVNLEQFAKKLGQQIKPSTRQLRYAAAGVDQSDVADAFDDRDDLFIDEADLNQLALFDKGKWWHDYWKQMPEFVQRDLTPLRTIQVRFENAGSVGHFAQRMGYSLTEKTKSVWFPNSESDCFLNKRYVQTERLEFGHPRYPVYVISKGRADTRMTVKALTKMGVDFRVVIEPQERDEYAAHIDDSKILVLPFSNLGQGSIPARNWVWEHSLEQGAARHWIMDDNIPTFYRLNWNKRVYCWSGAMFRAMEDFVDRYENIGIAGPQYRMFASPRSAWPPFTLNTRVYSCILIRNDLPYRWRGRYNEDTDLSLRALKDGWCTVLFYAFLADKQRTMTMKGGNTESLYEIEEGRLKMAQSLVEQHPDVTKVTWKWGRWQHQVDYGPFKKNTPILRSGVTLTDEVDDYGMRFTIDGNVEPAWALDHVE
jgi:hypothetical protein